MRKTKAATSTAPAPPSRKTCIFGRSRGDLMNTLDSPAAEPSIANNSPDASFRFTLPGPHHVDGQLLQPKGEVPAGSNVALQKSPSEFTREHSDEPPVPRFAFEMTPTAVPIGGSHSGVPA